ncbi:hypothetical protein KPN8_254 [Klebsiella phage KPN8]|nr:hypothetical protein KPN8_254 [Klebsiella phage KPN8]
MGKLTLNLYRRVMAKANNRNAVAEVSYSPLGERQRTNRQSYCRKIARCDRLRFWSFYEAEQASLRTRRTSGVGLTLRDISTITHVTRIRKADYSGRFLTRS